MVRRPTIGLAGAAVALIATATVAVAPPIAAYSLATPRSVAPSGIVARAVVPAGAPCPDLVADGRRLAMRWRAAPPTTGSAFSPILVCERVMPAGTRTAAIGGVAIPAAMPATLRRMAIFSDTGCRIKAGDPTQDCSGPGSWPLARIARRIAGSSPDVVLIPGDFFYREAPCPAGQQALCGASPPPVGGMPFTDSAYGWIADVLTPMAPLLRAAPVIVARGNHEDCWRAGNGFMLLMDPRPGTTDDCAPERGADGVLTAPEIVTPPYAIDLPVRGGRTLRLIIADSAPGSDTRVTPAADLMRPQYSKANDLARPATNREPWLVTHRPMFGFVSSTLVPAGGSPWSSADSVAASAGLLGRYRMIVSSHIHLAQAVQVPGQAGQLVLGNGGTALDPMTGYDTPAFGPLQTAAGARMVATIPPYPAPSRSWTDVAFGYAIATPGTRADRWDLRLRDPAGALRATCQLRARNLTCRNIARATGRTRAGPDDMRRSPPVRPAIAFPARGSAR